MLNSRMQKLKKRQPSVISGKLFIANTLPYVIPTIAASSPFLMKFLDPLGLGASNIFFDKS